MVCSEWKRHIMKRSSSKFASSYRCVNHLRMSGSHYGPASTWSIVWFCVKESEQNLLWWHFYSGTEVRCYSNELIMVLIFGWSNSGKMCFFTCLVRFINSSCWYLQRNRVANFLQLIFHSCIGGCNGCINMNTQDNKGRPTYYFRITDVLLPYYCCITAVLLPYYCRITGITDIRLLLVTDKIGIPITFFPLRYTQLHIWLE